MIKEIDFSKKAVERINQLISRKPIGTFFRIAVKGGGCSGFIKKIDFCNTQDITDKDMVEDFDEIKVIVDMKSMMFLSEAIIDYKDSLMGAGFIIDIPSATNSCGCGDSFSM